MIILHKQTVDDTIQQLQSSSKYCGQNCNCIVDTGG